MEGPDFEALRPWLAVDQPDEAGEWAAWCPLHEEPATSDASASMNFNKSVFHCFAGCPDGEIGELIWRMEELGLIGSGNGKGTGGTVSGSGQTGGFEADVIDLTAARKRKRRRKREPLPSVGAVEGWHDGLLNDTERMRELSLRRGLGPDVVKRFRIGWDRDENAYTLPFYENGELVNLKRYRLDPGNGKKMWGITGHNEARLYPHEILEGADELIIAEGEMDALLLIQHGFPAVTGTGGSKVWKREWSEAMKDRTVYIVYDRDEPGQEGARRVARYVKEHANRTFVIELPFDVVEDHGQDTTDLWEQTKEDFAAEFKDLMRDARHVPGSKTVEAEAKPVNVSVLDSFSSDHAAEALEMRVAVAGRTSAPYLIPKKIRFECGQDAGDKCGVCPMMSTDDGVKEVEIEPKDPLVLEMVGSTNNQMDGLVRKLVGAVKCSRQGWWPLEQQNVEELFVRPAIDEMDEDTDSDYAANRKVYSVGRHNTMPNTTVRIEGRIVPNPRDQRSEFLAWQVDPTESSIDRFQQTPEMHDRLKVFQPSGEQDPLDKMEEISRDISGNVTQIYDRMEMHIAMDLVWHSVLKFRFDDRLIRKGWLELLVVGDTRTGKSEAAMKLASHYRAGHVLSCEAASFAGIVGGLQQYGGKEWSVTWGAIPLNDRRLVVLDEVGGLETDEIAHMSSIRSSGVAELTKIQQERTAARTRLIWIGNPRNSHMGEYLHGVYAIPGLIGNPEDIARFDLAMAVAAGEVKSSEINRAHRQSVDHVYTWDLCRDLVMWSWSRKPHQVRWGKWAEREVYRQAEKLGERYVERPPLIQAANVRVKIARVAVALAARTYSTPDGEHVLVEKYHVRCAVKFVERIYKKRAMGYREVSRERNEDLRKAHQSRGTCERYLTRAPQLARFLRGRIGSFRRQDLEEMLNISREEANGIISKLWDWRMVAKDPTGNIRAEPVLNDLIREMEEIL